VPLSSQGTLLCPCFIATVTILACTLHYDEAQHTPTQAGHDTNGPGAQIAPRAWVLQARWSTGPCRQGLPSPGAVEDGDAELRVRDHLFEQSFRIDMPPRRTHSTAQHSTTYDNRVVKITSSLRRPGVGRPSACPRGIAVVLAVAFGGISLLPFPLFYTVLWVCRRCGRV
jgi:hypothetical protein